MAYTVFNYALSQGPYHRYSYFLLLGTSKTTFVSGGGVSIFRGTTLFAMTVTDQKIFMPYDYGFIVAQ